MDKDTRRTVVVVSRDNDRRQMLSARLEVSSFRVVQANGYGEYREALHRGSVSLCVIDRELPGTAAERIASELRESRPRVPFVVVGDRDMALHDRTGYVSPPDLFFAVAAEGADFRIVDSNFAVRNRGREHSHSRR
jgi:CheY-like chemotaxis protein